MRPKCTFRVGCLSILLTVVACRAGAATLDWQPTNGPYGLYLRELVTDQNDVLYGVYRTGGEAGLVRSDDGVHWRRFDLPLVGPAWSVRDGALHLAVSGQTLYLWGRVRSDHHVMRSDDRGETWAPVNVP